MDAAPEVVLKHQLPDGVTLIDIRAARLRTALAAPGEGGVEGIVARETTAVAYAPRQGMRTGLIELREPDVARLAHPRVVQLERQSPVEVVAHADIHTPDIDAVFVPVKRTLLPFVLWAVDGGDTLVEDVAIAHEGEAVDTIQDAAVADAVLPVDGNVDIVALLGLKVGIADDHIAHVAHVEEHIHLLERGSTEAAGVVGAKGEPGEFVDDGQTLGEGLLRRSGEIIIAETAHDVEPLGDVPVELGIAVDVVLGVAGVVGELVGGEIVVQVVGSQDERVFAKGMAVEGVCDVLAVAVVMVVGTSAVGLEVGLVVLVVGVGEFQMPAVVPGIPALQSGAVGIEMVVVRVALAGTEEIATAADERQAVCGAPREPLLDIVGLLPVETAQVGVVVEHGLVVGQSLRLLHQLDGNLFGSVGLRQVDGIHRRVLETGLGVPFLRVEREAGPVAPFVPEGIVSCVCVGCPGFKILAADDVDHAAYGIGAIEGRRSTLHNLYAPDVVEVHAAVVDVVHRLACHPLAVDEEEDGIAAEAAHVERCLLSHGEAELQSGHLLYQHVLDIGGIGNLDVVKRDQTGDDRGILQGLRRMRGRDHDRIQLHRVAEGSLGRERNSWHSPCYASQK